MNSDTASDPYQTANPNNQHESENHPIHKEIEHITNPYKLYEHLIQYGLKIRNYEILPESEIIQKCAIFIKSPEFKKRYTTIHLGRAVRDVLDHPPLPEIPALLNNRQLCCNLDEGHFIRDFIDYWATRTDAYPEYYHLDAILLLSIAINRKIVISLNFGDIYPNVWCMALGQSSVSRKTTALSKGAMFAKIDYYETALPGSFSTEGLIELLSNQPKSWLIKDECAQILQGINKKSYLADLRDLLSELFECNSIRRKLRTGKNKEKTDFPIIDPYITFGWATTPESFEQSTSLLDVQSGFLARFLYYAPRYEKKTLPVNNATQEMRGGLNQIGNKYSKIRKALEHFYEINFSLDDESLNEFNQWYEQKQKEFFKKNTIERTVFSRTSTYIFKLAAIYYVGSEEFIEDADKHLKSLKPFNAPKRPDTQEELIKASFTVPYRYFNEALNNIREYFIPVAVEVVRGIENKTSNNFQKQILQSIIDEGGRVEHSWLLRKMRMKSKDLLEHIDTLDEAGSIVVTVHKNDKSKKDTKYYSITEKEIEK